MATIPVAASVIRAGLGGVVEAGRGGWARISSCAIDGSERVTNAGST
ncbi:hypothetical protein [uncultured Sphingomonas sp.]|nr:hypothetical protein [uncultured Sphingomonas sp.]